MNVFISWSKPRSHGVAIALQAWLADVLQAVNPFVSSEDIEKGSRWFTEIADELERCEFGIVCLTPENVTEPWLLFEAGAISKRVGQARVAPFLLELVGTDVTGPLAQFQHVSATPGDVLKLAESVNARLESPIDNERLRRACERAWPALEGALSVAAATDSWKKSPERSEKELITEVLEVVRALDRGASLGRRAKLRFVPDYVPENLAEVFQELGEVLEVTLNNFTMRAVDDGTIELGGRGALEITRGTWRDLAKIAERHGVSVRLGST